MTARYGIGSPVIALLGIAFVFLATSCGQSTSSAKLPTPSVAPKPTPTASPPQGGPVPAQLLGGWYLTLADINAVLGYPACPSPATVATCSVQIVFTATTYSWPNNLGLESGGGNVVVNKTEIDFLLALPVCPTGVGRYTWTLTGDVLHFTPLNQDPCPPRSSFLVNLNFHRAS